MRDTKDWADVIHAVAHLGCNGELERQIKRIQDDAMAGLSASGGSPSKHKRTMPPSENKFHRGNGDDQKHYWLTPPDLMATLQTEFAFDFDACPYPKPDDFDGLTCEWGASTYANIPFGSIIHEGKKKGPTAWMRKAIAENKKGKRVVVVYPVDKWLLMMLVAGAKVRNIGDVRWCATEDGSQGKGTGRHIAAFILEPPSASAEMENKAGQEPPAGDACLDGDECKPIEGVEVAPAGGMGEL